jgi:hypothetical protein
MNEEEVLYDVAVLGKQTEAFFKSDVGKFLLDRIDRDIEDGLNELREMDCFSPEEIYRAQGKVKQAERLRRWLEEAVVAGLKAQTILEERED